MTETATDMDVRAVLQRLTTLEVRGEARDTQLKRIEDTLDKMEKRLDEMANDVRDAKTGLRVGIGIMTTLGGVAGWLASHFWTR